MRFSSAVVGLTASQGTVSGSTWPMKASGGSVSRTAGACIGLNRRLYGTGQEAGKCQSKLGKIRVGLKAFNGYISIRLMVTVTYVASVPAAFRMAFLPPGCWSINEVIS